MPGDLARTAGAKITASYGSQRDRAFMSPYECVPRLGGLARGAPQHGRPLRLLRSPAFPRQGGSGTPALGTIPGGGQHIGSRASLEPSGGPLRTTSRQTARPRRELSCRMQRAAIPHKGRAGIAARAGCSRTRGRGTKGAMPARRRHTGRSRRTDGAERASRRGKRGLEPGQLAGQASAASPGRSKPRAHYISTVLPAGPSATMSGHAFLLPARGCFLLWV